MANDNHFIFLFPKDYPENFIENINKIILLKYDNKKNKSAIEKEISKNILQKVNNATDNNTKYNNSNHNNNNQLDNNNFIEYLKNYVKIESSIYP